MCIYIKDIKGKIISSGAEVTFYYPGISDVFVNGVSAGILDSGNDWIKINVPSGTHDIEFAADPIPRGTISGTVTDSITGNPVQGATVTDGTRSDDNDAGGKYILTDVPVSSYTIAVSKSGYYPLSIDSVVVTGNDTTIVDLQLIHAFDLVGFWAFEESSGTTAYDSSGNNNDGVIHGPEGTSGRLGLGYKFDGKDDYITVPRSASLDNITDEITMIAWVKMSVDSRHSIFERWLCGDVDEHSFEFDVENGKVWFGLSGDGAFAEFLQSSNTIPSDTWTHLTATSDGLTMKMYINGVLDPQIAAPPTSIHTSAANLHIGRWEFESDEWYYPLDGIMDEVKIYNRALTAQEITDDYNLAPVSIHESPVSLTLENGLLQAYPNPFNSSITISYKTDLAGKVIISIYNFAGQKIRTLVNETQQADHHTAVWNGTNSTGGSAGSGIYFCTLKIDNITIATKKLMLLK